MTRPTVARFPPRVFVASVPSMHEDCPIHPASPEPLRSRQSSPDLLRPGLLPVARAAPPGEVGIVVSAAVLEGDNVIGVACLPVGDAAAVAADVGVADRDPLPLRLPVGGPVVGDFLRRRPSHRGRPPAGNRRGHGSPLIGAERRGSRGTASGGSGRRGRSLPRLGRRSRAWSCDRPLGQQI